jgi:predicted nucleotidyltransferase
MSERIHPSIARHLDQVRALAQEYGVARLELFGSAVTPSFDEARSDVDFLVEYPAGYEFGPWLKRYQLLEDDLAKVLGRSTHLVMTSALRDPYFAAEAAQTRMVVYDISANAEAAS